ncbi:MAG TPA: DUF3892 domain-containing protein [Mycobacterium sp.]|nr:DUF3892 domain-containing protein [Mycobacterium sp.]
MDRPDTLIELHRERVQVQAAAIYNGGHYEQPVIITDPVRVNGTATLNLTLSRVWFLFDSHARLWQEELGGLSRDPLRHFAFDLSLSDSKIVIQSIAGIPLVPLPPGTVTVPNGPRGGESKQIAYNEIPLFGRLTLHDQLERRQIGPGTDTISLDFHRQDAPVLVADPPVDEFVSHLFGRNAEHRASGATAFPDQDPRLTWDMDYAEVFWTTHSLAGELLVAQARLKCPTVSDAEARIAVLDSIAAKIADAVGGITATLGAGGVVDLLPTPMAVDPASDDDSTTKEIDAVVQRFQAAGATGESMVVQVRRVRDLPIGEELPRSVLAENPVEQTVLATSGFGILRGVRETIMHSFCLAESDFTDAPCKLDGSKSVNIGGENRNLDAFEGHIEPATDTEPGRLIVEGAVSDSTTLYDFDATFTITYEFDLDDIPREVASGEIGTSTGETKAQLDASVREAGEARCRGDISATEYEAEVKRVSELVKELPRTVGVRPTLRPAEPDVHPDFSLTAAGYALAALGVILLVIAVSLPVTAPAAAAGGIAALSAEAVIGLLILAIVEYVVILITIDWVGTGIVSSEVEDALGDRPGGTLLPTVGVPIEATLTTHLAVFFRQLPPRLGISCVKKDTVEDIDEIIQLVGGRWPTDGKPWRISDNDGALLIDEGKLELFIDAGAGVEQPIHVSTSSRGRRFLRTNPNEGPVDNLGKLSDCSTP